MHIEIEKLIKYAVADGELTEKKRAIILRKAETLGEDKDEVEMIIDGEMALASKELNKIQLSASFSNKEGNIKKCPSCGAPVPSMSLKCSECGHEFRNTDSSKSVKEFYNLLKSSKPEDKSTIISDFPIPNNKEDLIEFISISVGQSRHLSDSEVQVFVNNMVDAKKTGSVFKPEYLYRTMEIKAWQGKAEAAIMKAKVLFLDNQLLTEQVISYEKQFKTNRSHKQKSTYIKAFIFIFLFILIFIWMAIMTSH